LPLIDWIAEINFKIVIQKNNLFEESDFLYATNKKIEELTICRFELSARFKKKNSVDLDKWTVAVISVFLRKPAASSNILRYCFIIGGVK
jgi:hypothetical protein